MDGWFLIIYVNKQAILLCRRWNLLVSNKRWNCALLFVLAICKKKYCVFNVSNVGGVFNNLDKKNLAEGGYLINIEVNIRDVYAYITSMVFLVASNSGIRTKKQQEQRKRQPNEKRRKRLTQLIKLHCNNAVIVC